MTGQTVLPRSVYLACWTVSCSDEWELDLVAVCECVCWRQLWDFSLCLPMTLREHVHVVCVCIICVSMCAHCVYVYACMIYMFKVHECVCLWRDPLSYKWEHCFLNLSVLHSYMMTDTAYTHTRSHSQAPPKLCPSVWASAPHSPQTLLNGKQNKKT